jgi:hypothetical protein
MTRQWLKICYIISPIPIEDSIYIELIEDMVDYVDKKCVRFVVAVCDLQFTITNYSNIHYQSNANIYCESNLIKPSLDFVLNHAPDFIEKYICRRILYIHPNNIETYSVTQLDKYLTGLYMYRPLSSGSEIIEFETRITYAFDTIWSTIGKLIKNRKWYNRQLYIDWYIYGKIHYKRYRDIIIEQKIQKKFPNDYEWLLYRDNSQPTKFLMVYPYYDPSSNTNEILYADHE